MRIRILLPELELAVADLLMVIEAIVSGNGGGDGDGKKVVRPSLEAEHFEADEESPEGAVGNAAEEAAHAYGCGQSGGKAQKRSDDGTEGCADEQRGDDLAALEAGGNGYSCKEDLQKKGENRYRLALQAFRDDMTACAVVELASGEEGHSQKDDSHDHSPGDRGSRDLSRQCGDLAQRDDKENAHQGAQDCEDKGGNGQGERRL